MKPSVAPGQRQPWYPWPYTEGLTMAEAINDLAFMVTGVYGKPLPKQKGAPLRLAVPWKYGFKSVKSIVQVRFHRQAAQDLLGGGRAPASTASGPTSIPRCRIRAGARRPSGVIGTDKRVPTQLFNGYAEQVADLYKDMKNLGDLALPLSTCARKKSAGAGGRSGVKSLAWGRMGQTGPCRPRSKGGGAAAARSNLRERRHRRGG